MTVFRAATSDDLPQIAALWHAGWHSAHPAIVPPELTRLRTQDSFLHRATKMLDHTRVAQTDGTISGMTILKHDEVDQFYVASGYHGTGLAQDLLRDAEAQLASRGHTRIWLACSVGNSRAARFYEKSGWTLACTEVLHFETSGAPFPLEIWRYEKTLG